MYQVSILVPIYNVEKYIERCVRSLMEQTYSDIQYVFVDDCSPDRSKDILEKVISEYPDRAKKALIISHNNNRGLSASRNTAVAHATGEFLCHVDSDDYIEKDAIENLVKRQHQTDADIVTGLALIEKQGEKSIVDFREFTSKQDMILDVIKPTLRHTIWGRLIRRSIYLNNNIHATVGTNVGEDVQVLPCLFYYAHKYAFFYGLVYHYNCENENSYVYSTEDINKLCYRGEQDVKSYLIVRDFFRDKDGLFYSQAESGVSLFVQILMYNYIQVRDRKNFNKIRLIYNQLNTNYKGIGTWYSLHQKTGYQYDYCCLTASLFQWLRSNYNKLNNKQQ